jgi:UDP-N-acetylglucosamine--N-acetylmuramyl-(pentapeptide) pyrophosphoryl-undecaprenol N-acetylglucosamine transferase
MRVYVAPCGIGLGHVTRSHQIAKELNKRGVETIYSTYLDGLEYAKHNHLPSLEAVPINFKVTSDGTIDFKLTAATSGFSLGIRRFLRQVTREIQFMKRFKPDVVLSDSRASSLIAAWLLRIPVVLILNQFRVEIIKRPSSKVSLFDKIFFIIANLGWIFIRTGIQLVWVRSEAILIPDLPNPYTISSGNLAIPKGYVGKVKLIGPIASVANGVKDDRKRLGFTSQTPLIYAAISGPKIEREALNRLLMKPLSELAKKYNVAFSKGQPIDTLTKQISDRFQIYDWIENQDEFIRACDMIVSRAGHGIMMKSMSYGKPMVLIPIPDHTEQYGNARRAVSLNLAELIYQSELNYQTLNEAVEKILNFPEYKLTAQRVKAVANSMDALGLACDTIMKASYRP